MFVAPHHDFNAHLHAINVIGGAIFVGTLALHLPTLAYYTAAVGAVWYTLLAIRLVLQSIKETKAWFKVRRDNKDE